MTAFVGAFNKEKARVGAFSGHCEKRKFVDSSSTSIMNVVMLVDSSNYHHQRQATRHARTLPKPPKEKESSSRSKSLSRKEEAKLQAQPGAKLSTSSHQLSAQARREESVEVPVIVDEVTKWISGVTRTTTCRDVISVILRRNNHQYKVRTAPGWGLGCNVGEGKLESQEH